MRAVGISLIAVLFMVLWWAWAVAAATPAGLPESAPPGARPAAVTSMPPTASRGEAPRRLEFTAAARNAAPTPVANTTLRAIVRDEYGTAPDGAEVLVDRRIAEDPDRHAGTADAVLQHMLGGALEGTAHGPPGAGHTGTVQLWRLEHEAEVEAVRTHRQPWRNGMAWTRRAEIGSDGKFAVHGLEPGAWRLAVSRRNLASAIESPLPADAAPLIDTGIVPRLLFDITIAPGLTTHLDLHEPPLGTLRGRVLQNGAPCRDVRVLAVRPDLHQVDLLLVVRRLDWDDELTRSFVASQRTGDDGSFEFHYRDAGPVELRLRHEHGAATHAPIVVELPPPGADVVRDLVFAGGSIRGRFALEQLATGDRLSTAIVLYPPHKALDDPTVSTDWQAAISSGCCKVEFDEQHDGRFAFDHLPDGDWLLRVQSTRHDDPHGPLWQRLVTVERGALLQLGDVTPQARVRTTLRWRWDDAATLRTTYGIWLRAEHHGHTVWCRTLRNVIGQSTWNFELDVPPGRYSVVPFGYRGDALADFRGLGTIPEGEQLGTPTAIEVRADGSIAPDEVVFVPLQTK